MSISKRVAYLKGLAEGLELDTESKEGKLISVMIEILEKMALSIEDIEDDLLAIDDEIADLGDDLEDMEDLVYDDHDCHHGHGHDDCEACDEQIFYEVKCPNCGEETTIDEDVLESGGISCPSCGEKLEFDLDAFEDDEDDGD